MKNIFIEKYLFFLSSLLFPCSLMAKFPHRNFSELPNIVYILADDLGYGDVSCYNEKSKINTPHIDKLASEGIMFTDAHTSSALCTPTRYGILTGRYNWRSVLKSSVLWGYSKALIIPERLTIGKLLQKNQYNTAYIGKWHLGWDWHFTEPNNWQSGPLARSSEPPKVDFSKPIQNGPNNLGFSYFYGISGSLDMPPYVYVENNLPTTIPKDTSICADKMGVNRWQKGIIGSDFSHVDVLPNITERSIQYINKRAQINKPFFLYVALTAPHIPLLPTPKFIGKSNTTYYGDFVLEVDDVVGQILVAIEKNAIERNTIVIFASDNGCSPKVFEDLKIVGHYPSYIFRGGKGDIYEGGHRVPFILKWPDKVRPGLKTDEIICTTDLMATLADILEYPLPGNAAEDSYSFLPVLTYQEYKRPIREAIVHHSQDGRFAIRKGDWKLILWPGSGGRTYPTKKEKFFEDLPKFQLYNLKNDPSEKYNLVINYPEKVKELKELLTKYIELGRSTPGRPQKNEGMDSWDQINWMN
jgi:arylsulfatase A